MLAAAPHASAAAPFERGMLLAGTVVTMDGRDRVDARVGTLAGDPAGAAAELGRMRAGLVDAFLVHLGEGVRDGDRRPGDTFSSRGEFAGLRAAGLLRKKTVIVHGTALEGRQAPDPPFRLYPFNVNQASGGSNPFAGFESRWYR